MNRRLIIAAISMCMLIVVLPNTAYAIDGAANTNESNYELIYKHELLQPTQFTTLFAQGDGTAVNPYGISTPEELNAVRNDLDAHYILLNDIDMSGATGINGVYYNDGDGWYPIGTYESPFTGVLNGNGKKIYGLQIDRPYKNKVGLFGDINGPNALVENLMIEKCDLHGNYQVGGVVGYLEKGTIKNCHVNGSIRVITYRVGGIAGEVKGESGNLTRITGCTSNGKISGSAHVAGIAGIVTNYSELSQCYSTADIYGYDYVGGIVGYLDNSRVENCFNIGRIDGYRNSGSLFGSVLENAIVSNCYSAGIFENKIDNIIAGAVFGTITNCYVLSSKDESGLLPEEMTHQDSFSGFDFDSVWEIAEGQRMPRLKNVTFIYTNGIKLSRETLIVDFTGPLNIRETIEPLNATNNNVIWESSNTKVATVSNGEVTAISTGSTTVCATTIDGRFSASCNVIVSDAPVIINIPDINLQNALLDAGADANGDHAISEYELSAMHGNLNLSRKVISNISGLEYATGISGLDISENNIQDISSIAALTQLTELNISGNNIKDISPIANMKQLTDLDINQISSTDFTPVSELTGLKCLGIGKNNIRSISFLSNLEHLQVLGVSGNELISLDGIENAKSLYSLNASYNNIDNIDAISYLSSLYYVDLSSNRISDLEAFLELKYVNYLHLLNNQIDDLSDLNNLEKLEQLNMGTNRLTSLNSLPFLPNLTDLDVFNNDIKNFSGIELVPNLVRLDAIANKIDDLTSLSELSKIKYIELRSNNIKDVSTLAKIDSIERITLEYNKIFDITKLVSLPNLTSLYINYNYLDISEGTVQITAINTLKNKGVFVQFSTQFIDEVIFTDINLKQGLIDAGMDENGNGIIELGEITYFSSKLDLSYRDIKDISGLENAHNLIWIDLSNNQIVDIGCIKNGMYRIENLNLCNNQILDISGLTEKEHLSELDIRFNWLSGTEQTTVINTLMGNGTNVAWEPQWSKAERVDIDKTHINMIKGESVRLSAIVYPDNAKNKNVIWSTSNSGVATVSNGVVTAENGGTATITVTTEDGGFTDTCIVTVSEPKLPILRYQTHVQNVGWQGWKTNGEVAGTSGQSLRLEGMNIEIDGMPNAIEYRTHVQDIGWQGWVRDGEMTGTSGRALRLEAIEIRLTGYMAANYDIYYRVHAQNIGWMDWAKNGQSAGTAGLSYRLEAIQIQLVPKGGAAPGSTAVPFKDASGSAGASVKYQTHVQDVGWQGWKSNGEVAGTSGQSLRLEGMYIDIEGADNAVEYRTHVQNIGWQGWVNEGEMTGTSGRSLRLEAIEIRLKGDMAANYDIYYRVHAQNIGWMDWAKNGKSAGTAGLSYRLEAIQIVIVQKGTSAPGSTARPFVSA